jgi:hypothetical protein
MKYRKLRIAWSVGWGVLCLLLIVLWVRSDHWADAIGYGIDFPAWLATLFAASLVVATLLPWRFTLRTLLIGMTVLAVVLGIVVWVAR